MRLAALPVGAANMILALMADKIFRMALMMVVLPVPGPPVITMTLFSAARWTASICLSASVMESFSCTHWMAFSESIFRMAWEAFISVLRRAAILFSAI